MIARADIWWADLPSPTGSGPGYPRPVLVIQIDDFNRSRIRTVLVVAVSGNLSLSAASGNVPLASNDSGLPRDSVANVSQVLTLDKSLLTKKVSRLPDHLMSRVEAGLRLVLGL